MRTARAVLTVLPLLLLSQTPSGKRPGPRGDGVTLLPNGWSISPAGKQVTLGGMPLRLVAVPQSRYAVVSSTGYGPHFLAVLDAAAGRIVEKTPISQGWMGLAVDPAGSRVYASAGAEDRILVYGFSAGHLAADGDIRLPAGTFPAGLTVSGDGRSLYVAGNLSDSLLALDLETRTVKFRAPAGLRPYACALIEAAHRVYVSDWGEHSVTVLDSETGARVAKIAVEDKPNDILATADAQTVFVANGNRNTVSVIATGENEVVEQIETSLVPHAPLGSTPNALALDAAAHTLYVANADNNAVAVIDVSKPKQSSVKGFIPTGWYPTAVALAADRIIIANGKGTQSQPNAAQWKQGAEDSKNPGYVGAILQGSLSLAAIPDERQLREYSMQVRRNSPLVTREPAAKPPFALGRRSPIRYVFYIIKENRTYDQVFGDMREGNGALDYCLFPEQVTPNHHALAREFVLLDNFYHNAEVSATGHHWVNSAYATDYVEKFWPSMYGGKGRKERLDLHDDPIAYSSGGFFWDLCARAGLSYRSYGEFARVRGAGPGGVRPATPSLAGHVHPTYRGADFITGMSDLTRFEIWRKEFREFEERGEMPRYQVLSLPGDHTLATRPGAQTPRAMLAENDLALGHIVDAISHSRFWKETAIFVVEDDAQNGPDHVDCHRTVALLISPFTRRGFVDSTMYSAVSMLRTMELLLGLPPMSQYDQAATPMWASLQKKPDVRPYGVREARIPLDEKNSPRAYGWKRSLELALEEADDADDDDMNELIWKSVKGATSPVPSRRVAAFVASPTAR